jgi:hypothetical protein
MIFILNTCRNTYTHIQKIKSGKNLKPKFVRREKNEVTKYGKRTMPQVI